jgi:hypothetical protein
MKRLIVDEVNDFRRLVRSQARAQQARRQDTCVTSFPSPEIQLGDGISTTLTAFSHRLPIPSREEIINSPIREDGATSSFTFPTSSTESHVSPVIDDPGQDLERELMQKASGAMP